MGKEGDGERTQGPSIVVLNYIIPSLVSQVSHYKFSIPLTKYAHCRSYEILILICPIYVILSNFKADGRPQGLYAGIWLLNRFPVKYPSSIYLHCVVAEIFVIVFTAV